MNYVIRYYYFSVLIFAFCILFLGLYFYVKSIIHVTFEPFSHNDYFLIKLHLFCVQFTGF